jgi:hypothetical protein
MSSNLCVVNIISKCDGNKDFSVQETCFFYKKAAYFDRCMWLTCEKWCTNKTAQIIATTERM